jgi:hypothetical protein
MNTKDKHMDQRPKRYIGFEFRLIRPFGRDVATLSELLGARLTEFLFRYGRRLFLTCVLPDGGK